MDEEYKKSIGIYFTLYKLDMISIIQLVQFTTRSIVSKKIQ